MRYLLLIPAVVLGLGIAWMDSRQIWTNTGITWSALVVVSGVLGALDPRRPWLWALGVSVWTPGWTMFQAGDPGILLVILFAFLAAYLSAYVRLAIGKAAHTHS